MATEDKEAQVPQGSNGDEVAMPLLADWLAIKLLYGMTEDEAKFHDGLLEKQRSNKQLW